MKPKYRRAVFVVTYSKNKQGIKYLILKRKLHWTGWEFPKGGRKVFEIKTSTVKRELLEETGLSPIKIKKFEVYGKYKYDKEYPDRKGFVGQTYSLYSAEVKKKKVKIDNFEHSDFQWLDFKPAMKKLTWSNQKKCLKVVNEFLDKNK
jgi:8-oxo-dGTP pyrophosphatase MutT (NUDIX family)